MYRSNLTRRRQAAATAAKWHSAAMAIGYICTTLMVAVGLALCAIGYRLVPPPHWAITALTAGCAAMYLSAVLGGLCAIVAHHYRRRSY